MYVTIVSTIIAQFYFFLSYVKEMNNDVIMALGKTCSQFS